MRSLRFPIVLASTLMIAAAGLRADTRPAVSNEFVGPDAAALREMLEGTSGRREMWKAAPSLVIVTAVMDYDAGDVASGYAASADQLTDKEVEQLRGDLTQAVSDLTDGAFKGFQAISVETAAVGEIVKVIRPGQIVVGRFRGLRQATGNLGYGGRSTRNGLISGAVMILDADFDRTSDMRPLLRTHELGHALGYHHVESRPSVMNPRVGNSITDFDRAAIRVASTRNSLS